MSMIHKVPLAPEDRRNAAAIDKQRRAVTTQINLWRERIRRQGPQAAGSPGDRELNDRRAARNLPQFENDGDAMVVTDKILVPVDAVAEVRESLGSGIDLRVESVRGLDGLRVLRDGGTGSRRLRIPGGSARNAGFGAAPCLMVPMGAIRKADGGPDLSGPEPGDSPWTRQPATPASGPTVAVIDTGISTQVRTDGWLTGLENGTNVDRLDALPLDDFLDRGAGHGTFAAGAVQQVAHGVDLVIHQALDTDGLGDETVIGQKIVDAVLAGAKIVNLSLGSVTADGRPPLALETAIRTAIAHDDEVLFVCAAGNYGDTRLCWPAAFCQVPEFARHVVSVAALRPDGAGGAVGAEWSTRGPWVTCSTMGQGVVSTYVEGQEAPQTAPLAQDTFGPDAWATWTGTSFAAPQIVGAVVQAVQDGTAATPRAAMDRLLLDGTPMTDFGVAMEILPV